jgi:glycerol kinase
MSEPLALSIDQGTHATRVMLVDKNGRIQFSSFVNISLSSKQGRVEQDPLEILVSVQKCLKKAVRESKNLGAIVCAGLATQRSSLVTWDRRTGKPLAPVISWQDCRAAQWLQQLKTKELEIKERTGLPLSAHYSASKLRWLLNNIPAVEKACHNGYLAWGPVSSYLLFHLLENSPWVVDHANAQRTHLFNLHSLAWDSRLLDLFGIPDQSLPENKPSCHYFGNLKGCKVPMMAATGDQQAALFSLGRARPQTAVVNLGTGAFILLGTGHHLHQHQSLLSGLSKTTGTQKSYLIEGTVNGAGAALSWASEEWQIAGTPAQLPVWLSEKATPPVFINSVGGLGSPWWRPNVTPYLLGEGSPSQRMVAVAESILFLIQANLDVMEEMGLTINRLQVSGGLARVDGLCQRLADLARKEVYRPSETEATTRGVAWLSFQCPNRWPKPGRGRVFRPKVNSALIDRFKIFCDMLER